MEVATIQPTIVETFGHQEDLAWIGVSFVLGQSLILPMYVQLTCLSVSLVVLITSPQWKVARNAQHESCLPDKPRPI